MMMLRSASIAIPWSMHRATGSEIPLRPTAIMTTASDGMLKAIRHVSQTCFPQMLHGCPDMLRAIIVGGGMLMRSFILL
jgi:hypothetical protein